MTTDLVGKRILITGAGKRVGSVLAIGLASAGATIAVHYHTSKAEAEATKAEIEQKGGRAELFQSDLAQHGAAQALATQVLDRLGGLEVLINNASTFPDSHLRIAHHSMEEETYDEWEQSININARAPFFLIAALAPALIKSGDGSVINILDTSVSDPFISRSAHSVGKAALAQITRLAAKTYLGKIRVNALEFENIIPPEDLDRAIWEKQSWVGGEAVVRAVTFLLQSPAIHGEIIHM